MTIARREFLKGALLAGTAAELAGCASRPATPERPAGMPLRRLGRTGVSVPIVGLGCAYAAFKGPDSVTRAIVEAALEGGIRYFDTAPDYTDSEEMLGPVLKPVRDQVFIATKVNAFDAVAAEKEFEQSLDRLQTDRVDVLMQHGVGCQAQGEALDRILGKRGSLEFMLKAKERGWARFIGMSIHPPHEAALKLLRASGAWDVVMPFVNYVSRAQGRAEIEILPLALERDLGVVAMKVFGGRPGKLARDDYERAFRYALSVPGVACALLGVRSVEEIRAACRAAVSFEPLGHKEMEEAIRRGEELARAGSAAASIAAAHALADFGSMC